MMIYNKTYRLFLFLAALFLLNSQLIAQQKEIRKEVKVVKPYEPSLSDVRKIDISPVIRDTVKYHPKVRYVISPKPMMVPFKARPIKPARLAGESIPRLYKSYFKLGIGNYITPLVEFNMSTLRSRDHILGFYFGSLSSYGKIKLNNDKRVNGGYGDTRGMVYGKKIFHYATLNGNLFVNRNRVNFYGYNPLVDTTLFIDSIRQSYFNPGANLRLYSIRADSNHLNYDLRVSVDYFSDKYNYYQQGIRFNGKLFNVFKGKTIGINTDVQYFNNNVLPFGHSDAVFSFEPWFFQSASEWRMKASIAATIDAREDNTDIRLYPRIRFQFKIIPDYLMAYLGMDGKMVVNDYQSIAGMNPYIKPGLYVHNTDHKMIFYLGLSGSLAPGTEYKLYGSYALVDGMPFFVNDTSNVLGNVFSVAYDDIQLAHLSGEFMRQAGKKLSLRLRAEIYKYSMSALYKPWHKPAFDASLGIRYNLQDKIILNADMMFIGKRYVRTLSSPLHVTMLKAYPDLNLSLEYRYRKILSFFIRMNNMAGIRYEIWNQYPTQGFLFMGGFTYSL